jgi:hypothetical protein
MARVDLVRPTTSAMTSSAADIGKDGRKSATRGLGKLFVKNALQLFN